MNDDAVLGGFFDFGHDYGSFVAVRFVELGELLERVFADDVGVEDEERCVVFPEDLLGQFERSGCSQGFGFDGELNADFIFFFILCRFQDMGLVYMYIHISVETRDSNNHSPS